MRAVSRRTAKAAWHAHVHQGGPCCSRRRAGRNARTANAKAKNCAQYLSDRCQDGTRWYSSPRAGVLCSKSASAAASRSFKVGPATRAGVSDRSTGRREMRRLRSQGSEPLKVKVGAN